MGPDEIRDLTAEALAEAISTYGATLDEALAVENPTAEQYAAAQAAAETLEALEAEQSARAEVASGMDSLRAAREERAAQAAAREEAANAEAENAEAEQEDEQEQEGEQEREASTETEVNAEVEEQESLAASGGTTTRRSARAAAARNSERPPAPTRSPVVITASADVPGFATGSEIEGLSGAAAAVRNRAKGFPKFSGGIENFQGDAIRRFPVAQFTRDFPEDLIANGNNDQEVMEHAGRETRLPGGSLVAAGGWCAPSETLYDLCQPETTDGLLSLPEFQVTRGGIRTTKGPDFSDVFDAVGNIYTEAQSIAEVEKTCYEVDCPPFEETRLDAVYTCIKVPLLQNAAYPELTQNVLARAMIAHQHKVSASMITRIVAKLGSALTPTGLGAVSTDTLEALELAANYRRQQYRISMTASMEGFAPFWMKGAIRSDLARRNGMDAVNVTDAMINGYLQSRLISLQWVYNWQPLTDGVAYPATVDVALYPSGSFSKGVEDVISLDAVYDAAELQQNRYTGLFFEEGILLADNCMTGNIVTIPICTAGRSGAADQTCVVDAGDGGDGGDDG
jgi:hypothetical protein